MISGPLSEADGQNILNALDDAKPTVLSSMTDIAHETSAWTGILGGVVLVTSDLNEFSKAMSAFEDALVAKVPSDLKDYASAIKSNIDNAVKTASAAYVNGSGISSLQAKFSQNPS
ncbi:hypothetical protein D9619_011129 [Psilocybe cf. subviscida]|uniref:Uncharacterized protein n=1 Tax=Psilocybe cf. subviscida TaxID=2480587 RepID=A0A8H5F5F7_9AGAR|nr:hypothetical protein D9619_011129 [Psilocybe cf. subviscida]